MKSLIIIAFILLSAVNTAQTPYEKGMRKAFELWEENKLDGASNLFERIASVEKENWLPEYYIAQIHILKCWTTWESKEESTLKVNLDKAQEHINNILTLDKENPYAKQMQAQLYTVWVAYDGMKYGMKYSGKISELYGKALASESYCKEIKRAIDLFATFKPATEFHPSYGLERAKEAYKECIK